MNRPAPAARRDNAEHRELPEWIQREIEEILLERRKAQASRWAVALTMLAAAAMLIAWAGTAILAASEIVDAAARAEPDERPLNP